ncbi:uncharacterized protein LOC127711826 [Mytilus californianus]|uniref:uncharacterized protein LOC127711826 n=1 Tax=Mytilus californianus TaxID=6549 RepID=UPI002246A6AE|nr:uncharacterized protein LOC127711826 [Mytilus californianus]
MKYLLPLLILIKCHEIKGVLEWTVVGKVTDYGQNVTLFCNVPNCCPKDAGWDRWTPHQRTLFIDVKTGRPNKKYDGKVEKDGYTLIIQNLTKNDLNVSYSCLYGVTLGEQKYLLAEDVFKYMSTAQPNVNTGNDRISEGQVAGIIVGVVVLVAVVLAVGLLVFHFYTQKKKRNSGGTTKNYTYEGVSTTDEDCFLEEPIDVDCIEGEDAIFTCKVRPGSPPLKWLKGCDEISKNENCEIYTENSIDHLKLKNTQTKDSGEYCVQVGQFSRLVQLKITEKANKDERNSYMKAIEFGSEVREYVRIQVIGKDRVGKTSLVSRLLGYGSHDGKSTDGIEINRKCQIRKKDGEWIVGKVDTKKKDMIRRILHASTVKQKVQNRVSGTSTPHTKLQPKENLLKKEKKPNVQEPNKSQDHLPTTEKQEPVPSARTRAEGLYEQPKIIVDTNITSVDSNSKSDEDTFKSNEESTKTTKRKETTNPEQMPESSIKSLDNKNHVNADNITEAIIENMNEILSGAKFEKDKMTSEGLVECGIWDFAGQKDYYATHQTFFTPHAIYLLVADITEDIKDIQHDENADFDKIGEYIGFWFDSIHCFCTNPSSNKLCPPVIMVCTGIDKVDKVENRKREYDKNFRRMFEEQKKINHRRGIYFISNKYPDEKEIESLKKHIWQTATEMNYFSEKRPTRWINLENALEVLKDMGETVYSWKNTVKLAEKNSIEEKELVLFLNYHHKIGNIIFFDDKPDYIILQPNWLVKCFRCLVCDEQKYSSATGTEIFKLKVRGELSETLLDELFEKDTDLKFGEYKPHILDVMEKFDIIVKPHFSNSDTKSYYMPCMIETSSSLTELKEKCFNAQGHCTPWLVLEFEFLPVAYYNHIMFDYIRQYTVCEEERGHPTIYKGKAVVYLDEKDSKLLIICFSKNAIALQIWEWKWSDANTELYEKILKELCGKIDKLEDRLIHNLHYKIKAKCSTGDYSQSCGRISCEELTRQCTEAEEYNCKEHKGVWHNKTEIENTWLKHAPAIESEMLAKKEKRAKEIEELRNTTEKEDNSGLETEQEEVIPKIIRVYNG